MTLFPSSFSLQHLSHHVAQRCFCPVARYSLSSSHCCSCSKSTNGGQQQLYCVAATAYWQTWFVLHTWLTVSSCRDWRYTTIAGLPNVEWDILRIDPSARENLCQRQTAYCAVSILLDVIFFILIILNCINRTTVEDQIKHLKSKSRSSLYIKMLCMLTSFLYKQLL